jgi:hypothetical protein
MSPTDVETEPLQQEVRCGAPFERVQTNDCPVNEQGLLLKSESMECQELHKPGTGRGKPCENTRAGRAQTELKAWRPAWC